MITLAFANLVRTTVTVGELLGWLLISIFTAVFMHVVLGNDTIVELNRVKIYCAANFNFVIWFLFLVVIGVFGKSNDMKVENGQDN